MKEGEEEKRRIGTREGGERGWQTRESGAMREGDREKRGQSKSRGGREEKKARKKLKYLQGSLAARVIDSNCIR